MVLNEIHLHAEEYKEQIARLGLDSVQRWIDYLAGSSAPAEPPNSIGSTRLQAVCRPAVPRSFLSQWDDHRILCRGGLIGTSRAETEFRNLQTLHRRGLDMIACGH